MREKSGAVQNAKAAQRFQKFSNAIPDESMYSLSTL